MEIKIFGKSLFSVKTGKAEMAWAHALGTPNDGRQKSKFLPDFVEIGGGNSWGSGFTTISEAVSLANPELEKLVDKVNGKTNKVNEAKKNEPTPKEIYQLKTLHDQAFTLKTDAKYVDAATSRF